MTEPHDDRLPAEDGLWIGFLAIAFSGAIMGALIVGLVWWLT